MTATVHEIAARLDEVDVVGDGSIEVSSVTHDSRSVQPGGVFACVSGASFDGHDFAPAAIDAGAVALIVDRQLDVAMNHSVSQIVVPDVRAALGPASCAVLGDPSHATAVIGVTGTSGKTSVTLMLSTVLQHCGMGVEVIGTLTGARTTPEAPELQTALADAVHAGRRAVAMEVSSHALSMHRVDGTRFAATIFTNLGHDHLDFHGDMEQYFEAKALLFDESFTDLAIINRDDPAGERLIERLADSSIDVVPYGIADAESLAVDGAITRFRWRGHDIVLRLAGTHNVSNALAVANTAERLGHDPVDIADGLCRLDPPRGRFEFVNVGQPFHVAVDYAHKPDALVAVLEAARQVAGEHRVAVVIGCGGDRDREKRPMMGAAAVAGADQVFITSDNPRSEDPDAIIAEIVAGIPGDATAGVVVESDRRAAIHQALGWAGEHDVVLIAGKGHETEQIIGDQAIPFDDRQVAIEGLAQR